jgi:hypothetical protein
MLTGCADEGIIELDCDTPWQFGNLVIHMNIPAVEVLSNPPKMATETRILETRVYFTTSFSGDEEVRAEHTLDLRTLRATYTLINHTTGHSEAYEGFCSRVR